MLIRIIIAAVLMIVFWIFTGRGISCGSILFMIPYLVIGYDILKKAFKGIRNRQVFDENFLMAVATIRRHCFWEIIQRGIAVMLFYQIGELFQSYAVGKEPEKYQ